MSVKIRYSLLVLIASVIMIYLYGSISFQNPEYGSWELHNYSTMALASPGLSGGIPQPFIYRILGPYLAGLLPFPVDTSFRILSIAFAITLSLLLYFYLTSTETEPRVAAIVSILFVCNKYFFGFPVWNYYELCDLLSLIEIVLLMWMMNSRRWFAFGAVLLAGALTKETALIMIPVAFVYLVDRQILKSEWKHVLTAAIPAMVTAVALRMFLVSGGGNNLVQAIVTYGDKWLLPETWFRLLVNSFIPFAALPFIFFGRTLDYFRVRTYAIVYFMLVFIATSFGYNNERLMAPAFIVFYPLLASIMSTRITQSAPMLVIVLGAAVVSSLHHTIARYPIPREISTPVALTALCIVTLSAAYFKLQK